MISFCSAFTHKFQDTFKIRTFSFHTARNTSKHFVLNLLTCHTLIIARFLLKISNGASNPSSIYTGNTNVNVSNYNSVTLEAQWEYTCTDSTKNYSYTGSYQTFTAGCDGYYKIELWGAYTPNWDSTNLGGKGAYSAGDIKLSKSTSLYVYTGGAGKIPANSSQTTTTGGWNGGGYGSYGYGINGGGGGATDIRATIGNATSRIIVAAGGGGTTNKRWGYTGDSGGNAGGLTGYDGPLCSGCSSSTSTYIGRGATQISGGTGINNTHYGSFYQGCNSPVPNDDRSGGGGGWYGGGCSYGSYSGGGGGSSYISGHTGAVAVTSTSSSSPRSGCTTGTTNNACSITPYINPATNAGYTFTNTVMIDGAGYKWTNTKGSLQAMPNPSGGSYASGVGHSGNGYARITYLGTSI